MKQWLRNLLWNFLHSEPEEMQRGNVIAVSKHRNSTLASPRSIDEGDDSLNFTVYNASGGKIVEVKNYDHKKDCWNRSLHIITSDEDFGASIGKIVFIEMLKRG